MKIMGRMLLLLALVFLLLFDVCFWAVSTVFPLSLLHVCVSGRRILDVYSISTTTTSFIQHSPLKHNSSLRNLPHNKSNGIGAMIAKENPDHSAVKFQMNANRIASMPKEMAGRQQQYSCTGRNIYVYNLPSKFNVDLVNQCHTLIPWLNLCDYFSNQGMGKPIHSFFPRWYQTHQYALEIIFHSRISKHPCLVSNPEEANLFYIPYYGGLDVVRWHFRRNVSAEKRDELGVELLNWLQEQHWWERKQGKDHVLVLGKITWDFRRMKDEDRWGSKLLEMPQMQTPIKLLIERHPWQINDIGVPHPTLFHPKSDEDIRQWQAQISTSQMPNLISFAGGARPNMPNSIRSILIEQCLKKPEACKFLDCNIAGVCFRSENTVKLFMASEFCLQPVGDSPTRRSVFDSLVAGCIPVLFDPFTAYYQYPWHLPANGSSYSVFIPSERVRERKVDIIKALQTIPKEERKEMRRNIIYTIMPGLVYGDPDSKFNDFEDAFTISVNNLLWRIEKGFDFLKKEST